MAYMKAPAFHGKDLTLAVGRGDMKILDDVKYTDARLARFVADGFLVRVADDDKAPTVATAPAPEEKAKPAKKKADGKGSVTKSPASKRKSGARKTSTKK